MNYKEFRPDVGNIEDVPNAKSCFNQVKWMANHCPVSNRSTEWDWMNFYWRLDNKDSYSFADFASVYLTACGGGSCTGKDVPWNATKAAAVTVFGQNSLKANAWRNQGTNFGVDF